MTLRVDQALERAEQALEEGELDEVVRLCGQILAVKPRDLDALELQGMALGELGDWEQADDRFDRLLELAPRRVTALLAAADLKIRQSGDDRERLEAGLELLARAEPSSRGDESLLLELELLKGIALSQLGDFDGALAALARVLRLDPEHGEAQLEQAVALFERGRFDHARAAFEKLSREFPEEPWSFHYLGLLAERRGEDPERWFGQARALDPEEFPPHVQMTAAEFDAAVSDAVSRLPEHARPHLANAVISVEPIPGDEELREGLSPTVLGVFHGTPVDERLDTEPTHHQTVRITLFQKNLERFARTREELEEEIRITVLHEVGHLLGLDEDELFERGLD